VGATGALARAATATAVVVLLLLSTPTTTTTAAADFTPISTQAATDALHRATAQVMAFGCDLEQRDGTVVAVAGGTLVTNAHVVAASRVIDVAPDDGPTEVGGAMVAAAGDVATVNVGGPPLAPLALAPSDPPPGSPVRVAGFPSAPPGQPQPGLTVLTTTVLDYIPGAAVDQHGRVMRLAASVRPGMSGGPVLDASGRLAGIVFGDEMPTGEALVIPVSQLRRLLAPGSLVASSC